MNEVKKKMRKFAVFDIDGTIFRSSLLIELVEGLIQEEIFPKRAERVYEKAYERWLDRKDGYEKYIAAVVVAFQKHIKGVREDDFRKVVLKVVEFHRERIYRYTRDLIKDLKKRGYYLLAISHSPKYVVDGFAKQLGFHKVYGGLLELDRRGRFTGKRLLGDFIMDKARVLHRAVLKENLAMSGSIGVGDTESDVPFLKLVEKPICFNPNQTLYLVARKRGWKVVVERKDVIYELEK